MMSAVEPVAADLGGARVDVERLAYLTVGADRLDGRAVLSLLHVDSDPGAGDRGCERGDGSGVGMCVLSGCPHRSLTRPRGHTASGGRDPGLRAEQLGNPDITHAVQLSTRKAVTNRAPRSCA